MKTLAEISSNILKLTMKIQENHPELSNYLSEMPDTIPEKKYMIINKKILKKYYNSLVMLVKKYELEHQNSITIK